ncbi:calcium-dependent phosphotriesterase [Gonapodya prolifera JEL478]|uniref:Calcium-dependent phosphotriesterase n=1 Tax=Gonapodya prolifera (strain JEL478) TaxID=1344416 RepID=A0A139A8N7_GONPJ|nr:calcium-dependent phosphotriesterase [Gonapodya prolifera JEL478]|eukprot:KXS12753.1 calcium-dependent phosphotriesterase [Gonapodya prolifera JEL478]
MTGPNLIINPAAQADPSLAHLLPSADAQSSVRFVKVAEGHTWVEGPSYLKHADAFVFSDIPKSEQWAVDRKTGHTRLARWGTGLTNGTFPSPRLSAIASESGAKLGRERKWDVILCCEHAGRRISAVTYEVVPDNQGGKRSDHIEAVEKKILVDNYQGLPFNSPNDVVELPDGSVLFTDPSYGCYPSTVEGHGFLPAQPETAVYRFHLSDPQGTLEKVITGMLMPNGLTFVAPSTLVVADSGGCLPAHLDPKILDMSRPHHLKAFTVPVAIQEVDTVEATLGTYSGKWGDISRTAKILMDALNGIPDGIRHDPLGRIYSSTFNGVDVYAPLCSSGAEPAHLFTLNFPTMTANFCFGGPDMDELCICNNHDVWLVKGLGIKGCA